MIEYYLRNNMIKTLYVVSTFLLCWMSTERTDTTSCKEGKVMSIVSIVSILRYVQLKISTMQVDTDEVTAIKTMLTRSDTVLKLSFSQCWLYHWQISNLNKVIRWPYVGIWVGHECCFAVDVVTIKNPVPSYLAGDDFPSVCRSVCLSIVRLSVWTFHGDISQEHLVQFKPN